MAIKKVTICDNCGSDENVQKYRIGTQTGSLYSMELCNGADCAGPVNGLIDRHEKTRRRAVYKPVKSTEAVKVVPAKRAARKRATVKNP